ncbi:MULTISPECIES: pseudouridine synthase [unclassified Paenibacillus]|uniref:pseudouridine synthase n=1 Tax=unclassified Paenibacillus TaxID=185978 RepID=UPI001AE8F6D7|nr:MULTISPECIES: pseudouridine synthase [unclassified Paenibacillus]MBP1154795.1 16S rRNA pseudouridine516 synthase [Paenibacillus sp. PvP091]MBP1169821.1 16S rRNA pseudouridine516 synthase [Paenibacillus sp. PvR098]MBP2440849.1 16S rRNA pseudouridine516 synthase [Paenibacillus sp. PvP052]
MKATLRLDKLLAHTGFGTRSEIKQLVKRGAVSVNGKTVKDSGQQVHPERDQVSVDGDLVMYREFVYLMLNKPQGVISATEDTRDRTVLDLLDQQYAHFDLFPVGRLDKDTEGLLLLTNDGKLAHNLLSPRKHVPKTYYAEVEGVVDEGDIAAFSLGVTLDDGYITMPAQLNVLHKGNLEQSELSLIELTIMEGKFHQVKRMFQAVGKQVVFLKRIAMGPLKLDPLLPLGTYRELTEVELELLKAHGETN